MSGKNISLVYNKSKQIEFNSSSKIVIMSDVHRGNGGYSDAFIYNENIFFAALSMYYKQGYTYIELGDGDELWRNSNFSHIQSAYENIFKLLNKFYNDNRFIMMFGNHDIVKSNKTWASDNLPSFTDIEIHEGLILNNSETQNKIFLIHGHQVDFLSYNLWRLSRFLVKYIWRPLLSIGINDPTSAANNYSKQNIIDKALTKWSSKNKIMLIAGHTHRSIFPKIGSTLYFNDGCCVYPHYIKAIEIVNAKISLVQWSVNAKQDGTLFVEKEYLKQPANISDYYKTKAPLVR